MNYILDTNVFSDLIHNKNNMTNRVEQALRNGDKLFLSQPVYYEVWRGLLKVKADTKIKILETQLRPTFEWLTLIDADWMQAAQFWAIAVSRGKQLGDVDLLIAAVAYRLNAIIVSADDDFDALAVKRENWRLPLTS